jgi:hypothetical protein
LLDGPHIFSTAQLFEQVRTIDQETRANYTSRIAAMNLKKAAGGPKASMPEIGSWAIKNVELLKRQVELYRPHLTIACGTFDIVREVFGITTTPICDGDPNMDKYHLPHEALGVLLNFYHPQTRRSASIMFNWMERNIQYLRLAKVLTI